MSNAPLMPMATAVWLVENTTLTFKQISDFCKLHEVEIQGIADGEVAKGIVGYNPIMSGQLTREEIKLSSDDKNRPLNLNANEVEIDSQSIVFTINKNNEILYENKSLNIEELSNFIQSKNKKYILDLDKESSIHFFNRIIKEFKEKDIKKLFVKVIEKENDKQ